MSAMQWLINRCNEMDITEQLNWLGDAIKPYQAQKEYAQQSVQLTALRRGLAVSILFNVVLLAVALYAIGGN